jgi:hypothetical protein
LQCFSFVRFVSFVVACFGWQVEHRMIQTASADRRFHSSDLEAFVARALTTVGLPGTDAEQVARLMILADLRGSDGHGIFRLPQYVRRIRAGGTNVRPNIRVVQETDATALVDGDNGMGHLVMRFAAQVAIEKAQRGGIGWSGVRRSNHAGPAALYAMMPLERDMIGVMISHACVRAWLRTGAGGRVMGSRAYHLHPHWQPPARARTDSLQTLAKNLLESLSETCVGLPIHFIPPYH